MADRKHLFGTSEKSDFIVNLSDAGTKKLCAMYCIISMIIVELAALPYYLTRDVLDYVDTKDGIELKHFWSEKVIYWVTVLMFGIGILGFCIFLIGRMKKQYDLTKNKPLILLVAITALSLISALVSNDVASAMTGYLDRAEGMLTLIGYYGFFAAAFTITGDGWRKRVCGVLVGLGALNAAVGLLQLTSPFRKICLFDELHISFTKVYPVPTSSGLSITPHSLAAMMTVCFAAALAAIAFDKRLIVKLLSGGAAILMTAAGVCTRTVTFLIGFGAAALFMLIIAAVYAAKADKTASEGEVAGEAADGQEPAAKVSGRSVIISLLCGVIAVCGAAAAVFAVNASAYPESDGYLTFYDEEIIRTDSIRMNMLLRKQENYIEDWIYPYLWEDGLYAAEQNIPFGTGPDNWVQISRAGLSIDRSYNEYIDIAMQRGYGTLVLYAVFLLITFVKAFGALASFIRGEVGWAAPAVSCAVLAYSVQAFFNISALTNTPFFFLCVGLVWSYTAMGKKKRAKTK